MEEFRDALHVVEDDVISVKFHGLLGVVMKALDHPGVIKGDIAMRRQEKLPKHGECSGLSGPGQAHHRKQPEVLPDG
jgi:hypothetical protein